MNQDITNAIQDYRETEKSLAYRRSTDSRRQKRTGSVTFSPATGAAQEARDRFFRKAVVTARNELTLEELEIYKSAGDRFQRKVMKEAHRTKIDTVITVHIPTWVSDYFQSRGVDLVETAKIGINMRWRDMQAAEREKESK